MQQGTEAANMLKLEAWIRKKKKKTAILLKLCLVLYSEIGLKNCFHLLKEKLQLFSSFWWFYLIGEKKKTGTKQNISDSVVSFWKPDAQRYFILQDGTLKRKSFGIENSRQNGLSNLCFESTNQPRCLSSTKTKQIQKTKKATQSEMS